MFKHTPQNRSRVTLTYPGLPPIRIDFTRPRARRPLRMSISCPKGVGIRAEVLSRHASRFHVIDNRPKKEEPSQCT